MKKVSEKDDWLRPEYDLSKLTVVARGAGRIKAERKPVLLEADVAELFPTYASVNEALRLVVRLAKEARPVAKRTRSTRKA